MFENSGFFSGGYYLQSLQLQIIIFRVDGLLWWKHVVIDPISQKRDQTFFVQEFGFSDRNGTFIPAGSILFPFLDFIKHPAFIYADQSFVEGSFPLLKMRSLTLFSNRSAAIDCFYILFALTL